MSELISDIKKYLIANSIDVSGNIFLDTLPDAPDNLIVVSEYGGSGGFELEEARIQILVRNTSYSAGKIKINSIRSLLDTVDPEQVVSLTTSRKAIIKALQKPVKLSEDDKKRTTFICNFRVITVRD